MTKKLNAVVDEDLLSKIDKLAKQQQRTRSAMVGLLLAEAVNAREVG
jgi:predicted transcriptional regulator